jgi:ATP-binding cassette subfamily B protein
MAQYAIVLTAGGYYIAAGQISVGTFFAFLMFVNMYLWPIRRIGKIMADLGKATVSIGRIGEILDEQREDHNDKVKIVPSQAERAGLRRTQSSRGKIVFENVSFTHEDETRVLDNVSLHVEPGRSLAILGPSGSGKSTLINLLLRLYDYREGSIRLDGRELREMDRKFVRSQIGVVLQEPFLYSRSLRENIKLGRSAAHDEEMVEAASVACVHDAIADFDSGYDTVVGERGVTLSGGQQQRVALARAILKDPPILILDDALSSVDTRTENLILGALRQRHGRHTTLVIAHRLSTLMSADMIIVLEDGRIVQSGTHEKLLKEPGLYRRLWKIQSSLEDDLGLTTQPTG